MNTKQYNRAKYACFITSFSTAVTGNLAPLLFITFRNLYGLSYTRLGFLTVVNFGTQLLLDLLFSFFSRKLPQKLCLRIMPVVTTVGFVLFGLAPRLFPEHVFAGLLLGTVIFSSGSGLAEVLCSPAVAAIPSDNSGRLLSRLHSCYAWGVVFVVAVTTVFLRFAGAEKWPAAAVAFAALPFAASVLFIGAPIPDMEPETEKKQGNSIFRSGVMWLCVLCIFFGGASECCMSSWCSGFAEQALGIGKIYGDIFGVALFGLAMALARSLYAKFGKNADRVLIVSAAATFCCYIVAILVPVPIVGLAACALTGFCSAMLWPGSLMAASERIPSGGVAMFALLAAGGDLGAAVCPQLVGIAADKALAYGGIAEKAAELSLTEDGLAMKTGLAIAAFFPLVAVFCFVKLSKIKTCPQKLQ